MQFSALSEHLNRLLDALESELASRSAAWWDSPYGAGKWQRRQLAGHLIDSASNNHQRFVRSMLTPPGGTFAGPGYDQEGCVRVERFDTLPVAVAVSLLLSYNRLIAHLFANFPPERLATPCQISSHAPISVETVAISYVAHLEHHLRQLLDGGGAELPYSGLPWPFPE